MVERKQIGKELNDFVGTLTEDVVKALDIKEEKKLLEEQVTKLKEEEGELKNIVAHLKSTRNKLQEELKKREKQETDLQMKIRELKEDRAGLESEKVTLNEQVKNLTKEKTLMKKSLEKTNDLLIKLRHQVAEFDEEIAV